jgi:hypothetical protein
VHKRPVIGNGRLGKPPARGKGVGPDEARASAGLGVATFRPFRVASAAEKIATIIDSIKFCTACHAEGRGFRAPSLPPVGCRLLVQNRITCSSVVSLGAASWRFWHFG